MRYRIAGIFRGYKFSRMDHYKGFRGFYFCGLSSSLLAHAHINMQLYHSTVSLESIILNTPTIINFRGYKFSRYRLNPRKPRTFIPSKYTRYTVCSCPEEVGRASFRVIISCDTTSIADCLRMYTLSTQRTTA